MVNVRHYHGKTGTRAHTSWENMKQRCDNPNRPEYPNYGGRGITCDPRWNYFANFLADMGERPIGTTLERKDNDGLYCKDNCCWATRAEQNSNRRKRPPHNKRLTAIFERAGRNSNAKPD